MVAFFHWKRQKELKRQNCIYVAQWDKQDWVVSPITHIEGSYANRILQISMDRIINIIYLEKEKIVNLLCDLYMF